jgi:hypothetical protein
MTYKITINDEMFGNLSGEFTGFTEQNAIDQAKEFYASELDTTEDCIEIVSVTAA